MGSPTCRTRPTARTGMSVATNSGLASTPRSGATPARSAAVITAVTPGWRSAAEASMASIVAEAT